MGNNAISPYQQVIEKTKSLSFRSQMLAMNIEKKQAQSTKTEASEALTVQIKKGTLNPPPRWWSTATSRPLAHEIARGSA